MKKIVLVLSALMLAAPAWATVTITATPSGGCTGVDRAGQPVFSIDYSVTSEPNRVRGFALSIEVDSGATFTGISDYMVGECNSTIKGYGIFPDNFARYIDADNPDWADANYTPIAPNDADGAANSGFNTGKIIVEMGSLYEDSNYPSASGTLGKITATGPGDYSLTLAQESTYRGGVVMEDGNAPTGSVVLNGADVIFGCYGCGQDAAEWAILNKPSSWCNRRQCYGDADNAIEKIGRGWFYVGFNDLTVLITGFKKEYTGTESWIAADFDHAVEKIGRGWFRVGFNDINILISNFKTEDLPANCP